MTNIQVRAKKFYLALAIIILLTFRRRGEGGFGYFIIKENVDNMIDFNIFEEATKFIAAKIVF